MKLDKVNINGVPCVSTGTISKFLGLSVPIQFLITCGVDPFGKIKAGVYWKVSDLPIVIYGAIAHFNNLKEKL